MTTADDNGLALIKGNLGRRTAEQKRKRDTKLSIFKSLYFSCKYGYDSPADIRKAVFYGIRHYSYVDVGGMTPKELLSAFSEYIDIKMMISRLSIADMEILFPIGKDYDGWKYESKDYFSTMEWLGNIDINSPMGFGEDGVDGFFWNYYNHHIMGFAVHELLVIDRIARIDGRQGMLESFLDHAGMSDKVHTISVDRNTGTAYDKVTGEVFEILPRQTKIPRWIHMVRSTEQ